MKLQHRVYGKTGDKVSALGFGAMRLPMVGDHVDMDLSISLIRRAFDLGVNYVDSAVGYCRGESQIAVGKAVKGRRDKVFVSTKNNYRGESGDEWQAVLDQSLERIDVDYIDFYHNHALRWETYQRQLGPGKPMERFRQAKEVGLIRHMCFSCHDTPENMMKLIDTGEFDGMLVQYNLLDRRNEEAIAHAHEKGMGVAIMGPVGGGRLVAPSDRIQRMVSGGAKSTPEVALRFVLSNPNVTLALSGMNSMAMVEENTATASREEPLSEEERQRVLDMLEETKRLSELYCTGCGYCMPCPNDIDIPENFRLMNYHRVFGLTDYAREQYKRLEKKRRRDRTVVEAWAAACVECGECEPKCPQNIPIREQLKETHAALGEG
jgi:predicted aldo/keto reductase-like oxidoreductase